MTCTRFLSCVAFMQVTGMALQYDSMDYREAITNIEMINTSDSYDIISRLPIKRYEVAIGMVGKTQLGPLGHEVWTVLPESIQEISERRVRQRNGSDQAFMTLRNLQIVDKDVVFMHGIAATQELIGISKSLQVEAQELRDIITKQQEHIDALQYHLDRDARAEVIEKRRIAEAELQAVEKRIEQVRVQGEEERQTLSQQHADAIALELKQQELAAERRDLDAQAQRDANRDLVSLQEESNARLEASRRETEEILQQQRLEMESTKAWLERNTTLEKASMDIDGRIRQQRENKDIEREQLQQRLEAERVKVLQAIQTSFELFGRGVGALLEDPERLVRGVGGVVAVAAGVYFSRELVRLSGRVLERRLGKPSLVRETSRASGLWGWCRALLQLHVWAWVWNHIKQLWSGESDGKAKYLVSKELLDVVLPSELSTRVLEIARSTRNAQLHGAPYRHLLLYGPPGTGKTMVAKRLARTSNMDYAILSGGDVGPLGSDAVTELHSLFQWARTSPRGVLIFIDEAEAFLGCRASRKTHMSEAMRNALNALLFHTGEQSKHFMLVIATNRPEDLDSAITNRIDDTLHFNLPEEQERRRLLRMYFDQSVSGMPHDHSLAPPATATGQMDAAKGPVLSEEMVERYARMTDGMSGREIAKTMLYLESIVYAQEEVVVTSKLVERVMRDKVTEHGRKKELSKYTT